MLETNVQTNLVKVVQSLVEVCQHPCWGFICDLDGRLQNSLGYDVTIR